LRAGTIAPVSRPAFWFTSSTVYLIALNALVACFLPFNPHYPSSPTYFGASYGPLTIQSSEWWRLLTAGFVHTELLHLLGNMIGLWIFGRRLERVWGSRIFTAFYILCSVAGFVAVLYRTPFVVAYGASIGVFGVAGATLVVYGERFQTLSRATKCVFAILALLLVRILWNDLVVGTTVGHASGLLFGIGVSTAFTFEVKSARNRWVVLAILSALTIGAGVLVRHHYLSPFTTG
jgi:rhomboid protease GluP